MTFSTELPQEPGFYWTRCPGHPWDICRVIKRGDRLVVAFNGLEGEHPLEHLVDLREWRLGIPPCMPE